MYKAEENEEFFNPDSFAPLVRLSVDYRFSPFEFISFSLMSLYEDANMFETLLNNAIQQIFQPILQNMIMKEKDPLKRLYLEGVMENLLSGPFSSSRSYLFWLNLYGKKYIGALEISADFSVELGNADVIYQDIFTQKVFSLSVDTFSYAGFLKITYEGWKRFEPFLTFLYMSGDKTLLNLSDGYNTFVALIST